MQQDQFIRQQGIVPDLIHKLSVVIIGIGAIGSALGMQLAKMGCNDIIAIDHDKVELHNLPNQWFSDEAVGLNKTEAFGHMVYKINKQCKFDGRAERFNERHPDLIRESRAVFCCVDNMDTRKLIFDSFCNVGYTKPNRLFIEARMAGEIMRVLSVHDDDSAERWVNAWYPQAEVQSDRCTTQSTIYTSAMAAGLMAHNYATWLRKLPIETDIGLDLINMTMDTKIQQVEADHTAMEAVATQAEPV